MCLTLVLQAVGVVDAYQVVMSCLRPVAQVCCRVCFAFDNVKQGVVPWFGCELGHPLSGFVEVAGRVRLIVAGKACVDGDGVLSDGAMGREVWLMTRRLFCSS